MSYLDHVPTSGKLDSEVTRFVKRKHPYSRRPPVKPPDPEPITSRAAPECFYSQSRSRDVKWLAVVLEFYKTHGQPLKKAMHQVIELQSMRNQLNKNETMRSVENVLTEQFNYWLDALSKLPDAQEYGEDRDVNAQLRIMYKAISDVDAYLRQFESNTELKTALTNATGGIWKVLHLFSSSWGYDGTKSSHKGYELKIQDDGDLRQGLTDLWSRLGSEERSKWHTLFIDKYGARANMVLSKC